MTTISPNRRRKHIPARTLLFGVLILIVLGVISLMRVQLFSVAWRVGEPILNVRNSVAASFEGVFAQFTSNARLANENDLLRAALASSSGMLLDRDLLFSELVDARARLGRHATSTTVIAGVIARPPLVPYDTLILDAGTRDGVAKGDLVTAGGQALIGSVEEVYTTMARVVLFSAAGLAHDTLLVSSTGGSAVPLSVVGQGAGSFVGEVPAGTTVNTNDMAIFPGIAEGLIARVSAVDVPPGSSFKKVYLQFPVDIFSLRFVEVRITTHEKK
jgi:cell shape-determining protein MreC